MKTDKHRSQSSLNNRNILFTMCIVLLFFHLWYGIDSVKHSHSVDYAAFYYAGRIVLDDTLQNDLLYDANFRLANAESMFGIWNPPMAYIYPPPFAYAAAPLAMLPYQTAKAIWLFSNLTLYMLAIWLLLKRSNLKNSLTLFGTLALGLICFPFFSNQHNFQSNGVILFLTVLSLYLVFNRNRPYIGGALWGIATVFKLFPAPIALVFMLKEKRALFCGLLVMAFLLFVTDITLLDNWVRALVSDVESGIDRPNRDQLTPVLKAGGLFAYSFLVIVISTVTCIFLPRANKLPEPLFTGFLLCALFLIVPAVEVHHILLVLIAIVPLLATCTNRSSGVLPLICIAAIVLFAWWSPYDKVNRWPQYISTFLLWLLPVLISLNAEYWHQKTNLANLATNART